MEPSIGADGSLIAFVAADATVAKVWGEGKKARDARLKASTWGVYLRNRITGTTQRLGTGVAGGTGTAPRVAPAAGGIVYTRVNVDPNAGMAGTTRFSPCH